jgi:hypothetical protein
MYLFCCSKNGGSTTICAKLLKDTLAMAVNTCQVASSPKLLHRLIEQLGTHANHMSLSNNLVRLSSVVCKKSQARFF